MTKEVFSQRFSVNQYSLRSLSNKLNLSISFIIFDRFIKLPLVQFLVKYIGNILNHLYHKSYNFLNCDKLLSSSHGLIIRLKYNFFSKEYLDTILLTFSKSNLFSVSMEKKIIEKYLFKYFQTSSFNKVVFVTIS